MVGLVCLRRVHSDLQYTSDYRKQTLMSTSTIEETGRGIASVAERLGGAVVGAGRGWRVGSGVIVAPGKVLTAARHADAEGTTVTLADGARVRAEVEGVDRERGVAVLKAETGDAKPLEWAPAEARARASERRSTRSRTPAGAWTPRHRRASSPRGPGTSAGRAGRRMRRRDRAHRAAAARLGGRPARRPRGSPGRHQPPADRGRPDPRAGRERRPPRRRRTACPRRGDRAAHARRRRRAALGRAEDAPRGRALRARWPARPRRRGRQRRPDGPGSSAAT